MIFLIVFCCVAANHLGLIKAIEAVTKCHGLPIVSCPRCLSFWCTLLYGAINGYCVINTISVAFLGAWLAPWLELAMGYTDTFYYKGYDAIYNTKDDTASADGGQGDTDSLLPIVRKNDRESNEN